MSSEENDSAQQLQLLLETVERIRVEKFPEVPEELVRRILRHHADPTVSQTELMRHLEQLADEHLARRT